MKIHIIVTVPPEQFEKFSAQFPTIHLPNPFDGYMQEHEMPPHVHLPGLVLEVPMEWITPYEPGPMLPASALRPPLKSNLP